MKSRPILVALLLALSPALAVAGGQTVEEDSGGPLDEADRIQAAASQAAYDVKEEMTLTFIFHIDEALTEQDVFYERVPGSGEVFRPTAATKDMDAPLYAAGEAVPHTPLQTENTGPWPTGRPLGITLGQWFAAKGAGSFRADAEGRALFKRTITPCLQLSGEQLISELAIAWHSDGKTHGSLPGEFSTVTHVQMYVPLPKRSGL